MKNNLGYTIHILSLTTVLSLLTLVTIVTAQESKVPAKKPLDPKIAYDRTTNLLSIDAQQISLKKILEEVSKKAHVIIHSPNEELLQQQISIELTKQPLEQALKELLKEFNSMFFYAWAGDSNKNILRRELVKVTLLSQKASVSSKESTPAPDHRGGGLSGRKPFVAKEIVSALKEAGRKEREKAVAALLERLNDKNASSRDQAIEALKELAPEAAIVPFVKLMQDQNENRQLRLSAAAALEEIGDERVIDPFMWAFTSEPMLRNFAAKGMARIGGAGIGFLFEVLYRGDSSLRQTSAVAIAFQGDEQAKAALKEVITTGQVPAEEIPKDVFDELDSANREK